MESNVEHVKTTVATFNMVLREAGTNNYYCCHPSENPNILILRMPRVRGDRSTMIEVIRFSLVVDGQDGARIVYLTGTNELANWWRRQLAAAMTPSQAHA